VIDIGCGTGLSTLLWEGFTEKVIGVDINPEMLEQARQSVPKESSTKIEFMKGYSNNTGIEEGTVDVITCSQSFHWMDPEPTLKEIHRILRPGGVFACYDCDWPPTISTETEIEFQKIFNLMRENRNAQPTNLKSYSKESHLERMKQSGHFRYTKEILVHSEEIGSPERLKGLILSFGGIQDIIKSGKTIEDIGAHNLLNVAKNCPKTWFFHYRVRLGIK